MQAQTMSTLGRGHKRIALLLLAAALAMASWSGALDTAARTRVDSALTQALLTFATARALNGVVSVLQSGQVGAQLGVGMSINPGELLDPVNDLIESFSDIMLAVTVALGVHKVLLTIGAWWAVPLALSLCAALLLAFGLRRAPPGWLSQVFVLLVLLRFAVPVATVGSELLFERFLEPEYQQSQQVLDAIEGQTDALGTGDGAAGSEEGLIARFRRLVGEGDELRERAAAIAEAAGRIAEHTSNLIVVFVLRSIAFPVVLLWLLWQLARRLMTPP